MAIDKTREYPRTVEPKTCMSCEIVKPAGAFYSDRYRRDGLASSCKECRTKVKEKLPDGREMELEDQVCRTCGVTKPGAEFYVSLETLTGHRVDCKSCRWAINYTKAKEYRERRKARNV